MIKAIFFDIDGTLISFNTGEAPASTMAALRTLREKGIRIFIATGRPPKHMELLDRKVAELFDGFVMMNGQYCVKADGTVLRKQPIPAESFPTLLPYLERSGVCTTFVELNDVYRNEASEYARQVAGFAGGMLQITPQRDPTRCLTHETYQLSPYITEAEEEEFLRHLPGTRSARWSPAFTDIIPADGGKPVGVRTVCEHYGIDISETMAFGDGGNDAEMLQAAGIGVAMGNAVESVKAVADYVADDVDNDGLAKALAHFGLI